jgi:hypothetical protein
VNDDVFLFAGFDKMFSVDFCGGKAAEYFGQIADTICIFLPTVDLIETLNAHDQFLRRIFTKFHSRMHRQSCSLALVIRSPIPVDAATEEAALRYLQELWNDIDPNVSNVLTEVL